MLLFFTKILCVAAPTNIFLWCAASLCCQEAAEFSSAAGISHFSMHTETRNPALYAEFPKNFLAVEYIPAYFGLTEFSRTGFRAGWPAWGNCGVQAHVLGCGNPGFTELNAGLGIGWRDSLQMLMLGIEPAVYYQRFGNQQAWNFGFNAGALLKFSAWLRAGAGFSVFRPGASLQENINVQSPAYAFRAGLGFIPTPPLAIDADIIIPSGHMPGMIVSASMPLSGREIEARLSWNGLLHSMQAAFRFQPVQDWALTTRLSYHMLLGWSPVFEFIYFGL
jgi:hypothetical protein